MPVVNVNTSTDGAELIPAPPSKGMAIRIIGGELTAVATIGTVSLKSNGNVKWETSAMGGATGGGLVLNVSKERTIDGEPGKSITIGLSAASTVTGTLEYTILGAPLIGNNLTPGFGG